MYRTCRTNLWWIFAVDEIVFCVVLLCCHFLLVCNCNFTHPKTSFNLVNEEDRIFIELKTDWSTDNHNGKENKFHLLRKYKTNIPNAKVYYICLNDKCQLHVNYTHHIRLSNNNSNKSLGVLL